MTAVEARRRLACYTPDWTSPSECAMIPERGEAHPSEETDSQ